MPADDDAELALVVDRVGRIDAAEIFCPGSASADVDFVKITGSAGTSCLSPDWSTPLWANSRAWS